MKSSHEVVLVAVTAVFLIGVGCAKKVAQAPPPAPPAPAPAPAVRTTPTPQPATPVARTAPAPVETPRRTPDAATRARIDELLARIQDAYFDYDKHALRADAMKALEADSTELKNILAQYPEYKLTIEGHCDERGSAEYNVALGEARAQAAKDYLMGVGIPTAQLSTISYGKEHPVCDGHDETCWQKNRRVHIVAIAQ
jgi:peptidoglycan-associated lipoprotein